MGDMIKGSCLCGQISFTTPGPLRPVVGCHCTQCRKTTGHYVASTSGPKDTLNIQGDVTWYVSSDTAQRGFCGACGSSLFWQLDGRDGWSVSAGAFDEPTGVKTNYHCFTSEKGDYYEISDGRPEAPQFDIDVTTKRQTLMFGKICLWFGLL